MFFTNEVLPGWTVAALTLGYPAFMSLLALLSSAEGDDMVWLEYWICYGAFFLVQALLVGGAFSWASTETISHVTNFVLAVELPFLLWCMHPLTLGAHVLSELFFKKHAHHIVSQGKGFIVHLFNGIVGLGLLWFL